MVQSYREDSSVSEAGGLGRVGELLGSAGKGIYTIGAVIGGILATIAGVGPWAWVPNIASWTASAAGSAATSAGATGAAGTVASLASATPTVGGAALQGLTFSFSPLILALGVVTAAGGVLKGVADFRDGRPKKGFKEIIKGVAEGAFVGLGATLALAIASPALGGLLLVGGELISKVATGKTLTSHLGELVGTGLDAVMGTQESPKRQNVNVMQAQGMGMQQQMGVAPQMMMPQPEYGQMMAPGGMAYSAVPAGVGMPQQMMQQQPPATYWQDQVAANNPRYQQQAQEPVMLTGAEAGRYTQAVDTAREAANNPEFNHYNKA